MDEDLLMFCLRLQGQTVKGCQKHLVLLVAEKESNLLFRIIGMCLPIDDGAT
jgi:hypothetical protein